MSSAPVSQHDVHTAAKSKLHPTDKFSSESSSWTIEDSEELYRINGWGEPYFSIKAAGHVIVSPQGGRGGSLNLHELIQALQVRKLSLPILVRFSDILEDRIERLNSCFA